MVERKKELTRRYKRKAKMRKLKTKLARAKDGREKENIVKKILQVSPAWKEPQPAGK